MEAIIDKLLNFKLDKKKENTLREKAIKGLAGFFVLMILFTLLSRAADSLTIAKVTTSKIEKMTIDRIINAAGNIEKNREQAVSLVENLKIKSVNVNTGNTVQKGDSLMELDMEYLEEQILALELEIQKMELTASDTKKNKQLDQDKRSKTLSRAQEDYKNAVEKGDKAVIKAYEDMNKAYQDLQNFYNTYSADGDTDGVLAALEAACIEKEEALQAANEYLLEAEEEVEEKIRLAKDEAQKQSQTALTASQLKTIEDRIKKENSSKITEAELAAAEAESAKSNADAALAQYQMQADQSEQISYEQQEKALIEAYDGKADAYNQAVTDAADGVTQGKRGIEDAKEEEQADSTSKTNEMDLELKKKELKKLEDLKKAGGIIDSPITGVITEVTVTTGDFTSAGKAFLLADMTEGSRFVAQISKEDQKFVSKEDLAELTLSNNKKLENLTIESIVQNKENEDMYDVMIKVDDNSINIGESATMKITKRSNVYSSCIPLEALHEENNQKYLLVVREKETILGTELEVEKMDVIVQESNATYAALQDGTITSDQQFVISSNKEIQSGDRIRLEE